MVLNEREGEPAIKAIERRDGDGERPSRICRSQERRCDRERYFEPALILFSLQFVDVAYQ